MLVGLIACLGLMLFRSGVAAVSHGAEPGKKSTWSQTAAAQNSCNTWDGGEGMQTHFEVSSEWSAEYFPIGGRMNHGSVSDGVQRASSDPVHLVKSMRKTHSLNRLFVGYDEVANQSEAIFPVGSMNTRVTSEGSRDRVSSEKVANESSTEYFPIGGRTNHGVGSISDGVRVQRASSDPVHLVKSMRKTQSLNTLFIPCLR
jgi:hypothetical protein